MNTLPIEMVTGDLVQMARSDPRHFASNGAITPDAEKKGTFEDAMLQALDGVNRFQQDASDLNEALVADPESVDAHEVTVAMSEASLSLNITRTILDRIVRGWKEVINSR
jgi:flagellar hook-basal body complex protein FliE